MPARCPADVIDPVQAEWLHLLQAAAPVPPNCANDDPLARQLGGYRCLVECWEQALRDGLVDPSGHALRALARYAQTECLNRIRAWLGSGSIWDAVVRLPLPPLDLPAALLAMPGGAQCLTLWRAVLEYQRQVDRFCALYESIGADTLVRLEAALETPAGPPVDTVVALYALWQSCQDACEASIVRSEQYAPRLAGVANAVAALRAAHQNWWALWPGAARDIGAQRAFSEEVAAIRRQLRAMAGSARDRH